MARSLCISLIFLLLLLGVLWWSFTRPLSSVPNFWQGWKIDRGDLHQQGNTWQSAGELQLTQPGLCFEANGVLRLADMEFKTANSAKVQTIDDLPLVLQGEAELSFVGENKLWNFSPTPGTVLRLQPGLVWVQHGQLRVGDRVLSSGDRYLRISGEWQSEQRSVEKKDSKSSLTSSSNRGLRGEIVDAKNGRPLSEVELLVTLSQTPDGYPELSAHSEATPTSFSIFTDSDGQFVVRDIPVADARLHVHLQPQADGYLREPFVVAGAPSVVKRWPFVRLELRQAELVEHRFYDENHLPLAKLAVEVYRTRKEPGIAEDSWHLSDPSSEQMWQRQILYTDSYGKLFIAEPFQALGSVLSAHLMKSSIKALPSWVEQERSLLQRYPERTRPRIHVLWSPEMTQRYILVDRGGVALSNALVELQWDEASARAVRVWTDEQGSFSLGLLDRPAPSTSYRDRPLLLQLTTLSPQLWRHQMPFYFPAARPFLRADADLSPVVVFHCLKIVGEDDPTLLAPEQIRTELDLTLIEQSEDGLVRFCGSIDSSRDRMWVFVRDVLPVEVLLPLSRRGVFDIDLGDLEFLPGEKILLSLVGLSPEQLQRCYLVLTDSQHRQRSFRYPVTTDGQVRLGGLVVGESYSYAISGPQVLPLSGSFVLNSKLLEEGLRVELSASAKLAASTRASVVGLGSSFTNNFRVMERHLDGDSRLLSYQTYPMPPDSRLGSLRTVDPGTQVELFVLGTLPQWGRAPMRFGAEGRTFDAGLMILEPSPYAILSFYNSELGIVEAPHDLQILDASSKRQHEMVDLVALSEGIRAQHLLPGLYHLSWTRSDGRAESYSFNFDETAHFFVPSGAIGSEQRVLMTLQNAAGEPAVGAAIISGLVESADDLGKNLDPQHRLGKGQLAEEVSAGKYWIWRSTSGATQLRITSPGKDLDLAVFLPAGQPLDRPIQLRASARIEARVLDVNGKPFVGKLEVRWAHEAEQQTDSEEQASGIRLLHGSASIVSLRGGLLQLSGLPLGSRKVRFERLHSPAGKDRGVELSAMGNDLGTIQLEERRTLTGEVVLPNGQPAAGAWVALLSKDQAYHFPLRKRSREHWVHSTQANEFGEFSIDSLSLKMLEDLALIAHLDGYTDSIEDPIYLDAKERRLTLGWGTELSIDVGYSDGGWSSEHEFKLSYIPLNSQLPPLDLGAITASGRYESLDVTAGTYRLEWQLRHAYAGVEGMVYELRLNPGESRILRALPDLKFVEATARFNDELLDSGWALVTTDPPDKQRIYSARVQDGKFRAPVPQEARSVSITLIPEVDPLPKMDWDTGQGRPVRVDVSNKGPVTVHYGGYEVLFRVPVELLEEHPSLHLSTPEYTWSANGWREARNPKLIPVGSEGLRLSLIATGLFKYRLQSQSRFGWRVDYSFDLTEDKEITLSR